MTKWRNLLLVYKLRTLLALALLLNSYKVKARAVCRGSGYERDRLPARLANMKEKKFDVSLENGKLSFKLPKMSACVITLK